MGEVSDKGFIRVSCKTYFFAILIGMKFRNTVLLIQYCAGGKIEKNEMGGACGAYGAGKRGVQGSGGET